MTDHNQLLPEESVRVRTYNIMTKPLQKEAFTLQKMMAVAAKGIVLLNYDAGTRIRKIIEKDNTYGANAVALLSVFLGKSPTDLYTLKSIASMYTRAEVEALSLREMADGNHITWSHLTAIVEIKKAPDRKRMWERIFLESLSSRQVAMEALATMDRNNTKRGLGGGRKPSKPTSPLAAMNQIYSQAHGIVTHLDNWIECGFDLLDAIGPDKVDPQYPAKIRTALDAVESASGAISQIQDRLVKNLKRIEAIIEKHKETAAAAESSRPAVHRRRPAAAAVA